MDTGFVLFGAPHIVTLLACGAMATAAYMVGHLWRDSRGAKGLAIGIAVTLVAVELGKSWLAIALFDQPWQDTLPLHLCRISAYLCSLMLLLRSYRIFEVAYFWGIGGSLAAMLTPDLPQPFPHPLFLVFFFGHGLVLTAVLFAVGAFEFRPRFRSIGITAVVSAVYMGFVALVNVVLDTNYLYLCAKPEQASPYDYFGPWPWYIATLWVVGVGVALLCYAPFARLFRRRQPPAPP